MNEMKGIQGGKARDVSWGVLVMKGSAARFLVGFRGMAQLTVIPESIALLLGASYGSILPDQL